MKLLRVLFLLLASVALIAQDQSSQPSAASQQPSGEQSASGVGGATDKDQPLFKGCLSGTKDNYMLKDESGTEYRLHSDKDISEHVGNKVEIRGTLKKEGQDRPESGAAASARVKELDVADVKTVSRGCGESEKR